MESHLKLRGFDFIKKIGFGQFSEVWLAEKLKTNQIFAIKILNKDKIEQYAKVKELMQSEVRILKSIDSPNVVKLYEHLQEDGYHFFVMEYCNGGDFERLVYSKQNKRISEAETLEFLRQITNGFKALHKENAMHRDFKLANVLIHNGVYKIADLGFSKQADTAKTPLGTAVYKAPEVMKYMRYNNKIDVWSLGVCLYEMLMGFVPFYGKYEKELLGKMMTNMISFEGKGDNKVVVSVELQQLIRRMLEPNPVRRINWSEIYAHPLITGGLPVLLDSRSIYMKNIISYHAKVLDDGYDLMNKHQGIYIYFILSKRMLFLANEYPEVLDQKDEKEIYEMYFDLLLTEIMNFETFRSPLYDCLTEEFQKDYRDVEFLLWIQILIEYCMVGQTQIEKYMRLNNEHDAKILTIHLIELIDCFNFRESFEFDSEEADGFDFERHACIMTEKNLIELNTMLSSKICHLL